MPRPLRTVSVRYAEARRRNPNGPIELSDSESDAESISTSMIEPINRYPRRASSAERGTPVSRTAIPEQEDSGSEYSTADDEESTATPLGRSTTLQQAYIIPGPYADNHYSGSNDSGIGGIGMSDTSPSGMHAGHPSIAPSPHHTVSQARAVAMLRYNLGPRTPAEECPRHLERFPDLGTEPMALVQVPYSLNKIVAGGEEGIESVQVEFSSAETGTIQGSKLIPAQEKSILERTEHLLLNNHVPKRSSTDIPPKSTGSKVQTTNHGILPSQEGRRTSISDQQLRDAINQNFRLSGSTTSVNSQSTEASPIPGLKVNTNRSRPNGLSNGLPSSTGNGRVVPDNTSGLRSAPPNTNRKYSIFTSKTRRAEEEQLHAKGYGIEDTAKAFKEIEGRSREETDLILGGHLDKIFGIGEPPSQYVDAERRVQLEQTAAGPQGSTAEAENVLSYMGGFSFVKLGNKVKALKNAIRGLGEKRGRTTERSGSKRGRPRRA